ncbi:TPA: hypothetical protein ACNVDL_001770 [Morganella morganii]
MTEKTQKPRWAKLKGNVVTHLFRWAIGIIFFVPMAIVYFIFFLLDTPIHFTRQRMREFLFSSMDYIEKKYPFRKDEKHE